MLTQKMTKEAIQYSYEDNYKEDTLMSIQIFEMTLKGLKDSGKVSLDLMLYEF